MKHFLLILSFILFLLGGCDRKIHEEKIVQISGYHWHTNIDIALKLAKEQEKNIIVMVSEDTCRWCIKMDERTLIDSRVRKKLKNYILVSIKRSDKKSVAHLPTFDGNIPSFFFLEHDTDFIESIVGYYDAEPFLEYIQEIEDDV